MGITWELILTDLAKTMVVTVCGDPGGAAAVAPLVAALRKSRGFRVHSLCYNEASTVFTAKKLDYEALSGDVGLEAARGALAQLQPDLLVTATSMNGLDYEKAFIAASRVLGVPCLAVLDFWSNYRIRFCDHQGELVYVPDRIAVMDERARLEMVREGFSDTRLVVTGHPAYDGLQAVREGFGPDDRRRIRSGFGVGPEAKLLLFASEHISKAFGESDAFPLFPGYTEKTVLKSLIAATERIAIKRGIRPVLAARPHPCEDPTPYQAVQTRHIGFAVSRDNNGQQVALASDLVVGMTSQFLVEAAIMGCTVVSLQPGLRHPDPLPTNAMGLSHPVYDEEQIEPTIERMLMEAQETPRERRPLLHNGFCRDNTRNVLNLINLMVRGDCP